jgi:DMSO reductase family type II enzyme chaperone
MTSPAVRNPAADLYGLLAELLSFPGRELEEAVASGAISAAAAHIAGHLPGDFGESIDALSSPMVREQDLEAEFIRLFDVPDGTPTPLYTGVYARQRRDAMEELLRFYRFFGLTSDGPGHDLPDFVPAVLEFLQFLTIASASTGDAEAHRPFEAAKADVLERHLEPWARETANRLAGRAAHPFYMSLVALVRDFAQAELAGSGARRT